LPRSESAQKQARVAERRQLINKSIRSQCKTSIAKAERLIFSGEVEMAKQAVAEAVVSLDKAAEKGVVHPNNAARRKSRLMKKLNEALAPVPFPVEPEEAG
jgi:small subunit ribosomal protein S20